MDTEITTTNLDGLAGQIKAEHEQAIGSARAALEHALRAGQLLVEARALVAHGEWLPWLSRVDISERQAQRYMRLAANRPMLEANPSFETDLTITDALALIAKPKPEQTIEDEPPLPFGELTDLTFAEGYGRDIEINIVPSGRYPGYFFVARFDWDEPHDEEGPGGTLEVTRKPIPKTRVVGQVRDFYRLADSMEWKTHEMTAGMDDKLDPYGNPFPIRHPGHPRCKGPWCSKYGA
jgi:hypothetical protein